jgi:2,3-dihydroxybenzoate decarboxylase
MKGKIALEECWTIPESWEGFDPTKFAGKGVIGDDLVANLLDIHDHRLQQMDENEVDFMILSLNAPGVQAISDPAAAETLATLANDRLEVEVLKNPNRFAAFAAISMHDPEQAAKELARCMNDKQGFVGAMLNDFQSSGPPTGEEDTMLFYDDPRYDPFWKVAHDLKAPVYLHPRTSSPLIHEMMWKGRPWLDYSALGYANRLNMHTLGIITGGVLDRFPDLRIVVGHMGEHMYDTYTYLSVHPFSEYRVACLLI